MFSFSEPVFLLGDLYQLWNRKEVVSQYVGWLPDKCCMKHLIPRAVRWILIVQLTDKWCSTNVTLFSVRFDMYFEHIIFLYINRLDFKRQILRFIDARFWCLKSIIIKSLWWPLTHNTGIQMK